MDIVFTRMQPKLCHPGSTARIRKARLLQVFVCDIRQLSHWFKAYESNRNQYKLPTTGKVIVLVFEKLVPSKEPGVNLFTTFRMHTPGKEGYYKRCQGKVLDVNIKKTLSKRRGSKSQDSQEHSTESTESSDSKEKIQKIE